MQELVFYEYFAQDDIGEVRILYQKMKGQILMREYREKINIGMDL